MRLFLLLTLAASVAAADDELVFDCVYTSIGNCTLRFDADINTTYTLTMLHQKQDKQRVVFPGDRIKAGRLYTLTACNDDCVTSGIFWSPIIKSEYPTEVTTESGEVHGLNLSTPDATAIDYNVVMFFEQYERLSDVPSTMVTPEAHVDGDPNFPHLENVIHHTLYQWHEKVRANE